MGYYWSYCLNVLMLEDNMVSRSSDCGSAKMLNQDPSKWSRVVFISCLQLAIRQAQTYLLKPAKHYFRRPNTNQYDVSERQNTKSLQADISVTQATLHLVILLRQTFSENNTSGTVVGDHGVAGQCISPRRRYQNSVGHMDLHAQQSNGGLSEHGTASARNVYQSPHSPRGDHNTTSAGVNSIGGVITSASSDRTSNTVAI
nr:hypothetical protein [Tanacetum cinerariifolium]